MTRTRMHATFWIVLISLLTWVELAGGIANATSVVVPNDLEWEDGNTSNSYPFYSSMRYQQVFDASEFSSLAAPFLITQIRFRPDAQWGLSFSTTIEIQMNLATQSAEPDGLSEKFAENIGEDDKVVLPRDSLMLSSANTGEPKDFDIIINFSESFLYDPNEGKNLLLDVRNYTATSIHSLDAHNSAVDSISRRWGYVYGLEGTSGDTIGLVVQFVGEYTEIPPVADAGPDRIFFGEGTLDASGSYARPGCMIVLYQWLLQHRETDHEMTVESEIPEVLISDLQPGFYDVTLTVRDDNGFEDTDTMLLAVAGSCAEGPQPNASLNIEKFKIKMDKKKGQIHVDMKGSIDIQALDLSTDTVNSKLTLELFGILPDSSDLVISGEGILKVKDHKHHIDFKN